MDDRTEAPTPHRREEAREKGQVAKSVETNSAALMLVAFWLFSLTGRRFEETVGGHC
jgi:flagellar biosynthetic protein FlhB